MFRLVHLSDPHLGPLPAVGVADLLSKRVLGYVNWRRHRGRAMGDFEAPLMAAIDAAGADHVVVTGDLTNLGLSAEFVGARRFLERLGPPEDVSAVPGNHDAYVPGASARAFAAWAPYMCGDAADTGWPFVRRRGAVALVGLTTARASGPFRATGSLGHDQLTGLAAVLAALGEEGLCRVVLIHHQPVRGATRWHKRLADAGAFARLIGEHGAELILHGHTHLPTRLLLDGPRGSRVPVVGVPAANQRTGGHRPASGFNVIDIDRRGDSWRIDVRLRQFDAPSGDYRERARDVFAV